MAERQFVYSGAIPQDTDLLSSELNAYIGLSKLAAAMLGAGPILNNFTCAPAQPANLTVVVSPGEMYSSQVCDSSAYGDLGTNSNTILKQGVNLNSTTLNINPPSTSGYSQNFLIEFTFSEVDAGSQVLPYYNPTDPNTPYSGPNNAGTSNFTVRSDRVTITAKAGVAAPTGSQTTPAADTGSLGGFVVTVANGQTAITSSNITLFSSASFINETLLQKLSQTSADVRYAQKTQVQSGQLINGTDTGTANTYVAALSPAITSYTQNLAVVLLVAHSNTGASTLSLNGLSAIPITYADGSALTGHELVANGIAYLVYNGTSFVLPNVTPASASKTLSINVITRPSNGSSTYTPSSGMYAVDFECWGAGGGGGGVGASASGSFAGSGGGAGGYVKRTLTAAQVAALGVPLSLVVGQAGTGGTGVGGNGTAGGNTSVVGLCTAAGGGFGAAGSINTPNFGGSGGVGSGGDVNGVGQPGQSGCISNNGSGPNPGASFAMGGAGGTASLVGSGGINIYNQNGHASAGASASGNASGGSGASSCFSGAGAVGGNGGDGLITIREYIAS